MKILLVEDDEMIGRAIVDALGDSSISVDWLRDGNGVKSAVELSEYAALLLDLGLPGKDGLTVLKQLRAGKVDVPVLVITARDAVESRIEGLDAGADDYIVKPFSIDELEARIRAVVRRRHGSADPLLSNESITLNPATREVTHDGTVQTLSAREYAVLHALLLRPGAVLSRESLEDRIYGWNEEVSSNAIEVIIHGLRKKLGKMAIKNVRGLGWMVSK